MAMAVLRFERGARAFWFGVAVADGEMAEADNEPHRRASSVGVLLLRRQGPYEKWWRRTMRAWLRVAGSIYSEVYYAPNGPWKASRSYKSL